MLDSHPPELLHVQTVNFYSYQITDLAKHMPSNWEFGPGRLFDAIRERIGVKGLYVGDSKWIEGEHEYVFFRPVPSEDEQSLAARERDGIVLEQQIKMTPYGNNNLHLHLMIIPRHAETEISLLDSVDAKVLPYRVGTNVHFRTVDRIEEPKLDGGYFSCAREAILKNLGHKTVTELVRLYSQAISGFSSFSEKEIWEADYSKQLSEALAHYWDNVLTHFEKIDPDNSNAILHLLKKL